MMRPVLLKFLPGVATLCFLIVAAAAPASGQHFLTPLAGVPYQDWSIFNYVDVENGDGWLDYNGGKYTYNNHSGIDYVLPNFAAVDAGIPVYAAEAGTIVEVVDGLYD